MNNDKRIPLFSIEKGTVYIEKGGLQLFSGGAEFIVQLVLVLAIAYVLWQIAQPAPPVQLSTYQVAVKSFFSTDEEIKTEIESINANITNLEVVDTESFSPQNYSWMYNYTPVITLPKPINFRAMPLSEIERRFMERWRKHEGELLHMYMDTTGHATIGIGHCMSCGNNWKIAERITGRKLTRGSRITREEAERIFQYDVEIARRAVQQNLPDLYNKLNKIQQLTLIEMAFNSGIGNVLSFRTMLSRLRSGDYDGAARAFGAMKICDQVKERRCNNYQKGLRGVL